MAVSSVFIVFASGTPKPIGVALSKEALDAAYSHLPEGASVQEGKAIQDTDGAFYIVAGDPMPVLSVETLTAKQSTREQALAKLSKAELSALGFDQLAAEKQG